MASNVYAFVGRSADLPLNSENGLIKNDCTTDGTKGEPLKLHDLLYQAVEQAPCNKTVAFITGTLAENGILR